MTQKELRYNMTPLKARLTTAKLKTLAQLASTSDRTLFVGFASKEGKAVPVAALKGNKDLTAALALASAGFEGKSESSFSTLHAKAASQGQLDYDRVMGVGVGGTEDCHPQAILALGGKIARLVKEGKATKADLVIDSFFNAPGSVSGKDAPKDFAGRPLLDQALTKEDIAEKLLLGVLLGLYDFNQYKSKKTSFEPEIRVVSTLLDERKLKSVVEKATALATAAYFTRDLQTIPGNDLPPAELARKSQEAGRKHGFKVTVWDEKKLQSEGMNGILTVGKGSDEPPRLIVMEHNAAKKGVPTLVLIGKGVTFDTGGICIKPAAGMEEMKMDMSGAAAVIGAMCAIADLEVAIRVVGIVAAAENMPSGNAVRPGDIYTAFDGQTVEVINTDAEGRLVLADALSYAKSFNPDAVVDVATLTGACIVALGHVSSGLMGNNAQLLDAVKRASSRAGEKVWELPLYAEYKEDMRSKVADYRNSGDRTGGSQKGATFLNFFVDGAYPWAHLDVAGTADTPKGQGAHCPPDVGTAVPMRSLVELAENFRQLFKGAK